MTLTWLQRSVKTTWRDGYLPQKWH